MGSNPIYRSKIGCDMKCPECGFSDWQEKMSGYLCRECSTFFDCYKFATLVQQEESRIRTPQDGVRGSEVAPEFEQVSRCCK